MSRLVSRLASLRLTLAGIVLLLVVVLLTYRPGGEALNWIALPLGLLSVNLLAAIFTNRTFWLQPALLCFHIGLLVVLMTVCGGLLTHMHGRIELVEGEAFDPGRVEIVSGGALHANALKGVRFRQGPIQIQYVDGLQRGVSRSALTGLRPDAAEAPLVIDDRRGLVVADYRFRSTMNKGFAVLLEWRGRNGARNLGAINFPSFPEYEWKQKNSWTAPSGETLDFELLLTDRVPDSGAWTLKSAGRRYSVAVDAGSRAPVVLSHGQSIELAGRTLTVSGLRLWMGYRIDANPFLPWILAAALFSVASLGVHFQLKYRPAQSRAVRVSAAGEQTA